MTGSVRVSLKRASILRGSGAIRTLFDPSRREVESVTAGCVRIRFLVASDPSAGVRSLFVVSRRYGGAVRRNRIRRVMREVYRHVLPRMARGAAEGGWGLTAAIVFRGTFDDARACLPPDLMRALGLLMGRLAERTPSQPTIG